MRARVIFNYLLSERRFRGSLSVNHNEQRLDIHIQPDITVKEDTGRQTRTLSGGEKSFSTICLLLSLWDAMGSPIRCLDEFDVFMDQANRDIAMKLIIELARKSVGRQYILITPQAISNAGVGNAADVKIIRYVLDEWLRFVADHSAGWPIQNVVKLLSGWDGEGRGGDSVCAV